MKKTFVVNVDETEIRELERAWYECNSTKEILGFLASQATTLPDTLQQYTDLFDVRFTKCEMLKTAIAKKYKPDEVDLNTFNFMFDFNENKLTFTEA